MMCMQMTVTHIDLLYYIMYTLKVFHGCVIKKKSPMILCTTTPPPPPNKLVYPWQSSG